MVGAVTRHQDRPCCRWIQRFRDVSLPRGEVDVMGTRLAVLGHLTHLSPETGLRGVCSGHHTPMSPP